MDLAGRWDLVIEQGSTFERYFRWEDSSGSPIDLSPYSLRMTIRVTIGSIEYYASTEGASGTITISKPGAEGVFLIAMLPEDTESLDFVRAIYDVEAYTAGDAIVYRIVQGNVTLSREATT